MSRGQQACTGFRGHLYTFNSSLLSLQNIFKARSYPNSTMVGTGLTMEATGTNYIVYELLNEMHYLTRPVNLDIW